MMKLPPRMTKGRFYLVSDASQEGAENSNILPHQFIGRDSDGKMYFEHPVLGSIITWKYAYPVKPSVAEESPLRKYKLYMPYLYLLASDYSEAGLEFSRLIKADPGKWVVGADNG